MELRRTQSLPGGSIAKILKQEDTVDGQRKAAETRYNVGLTIPSGEKEQVDVFLFGEGTVQTRVDDELEQEADEWVTVVVPEGRRIERVVISGSGWQGVIYLPAQSLLTQCQRAIQGDTTAVSAILTAVDSPVQVPFIYGAFLDLQPLTDLVASVTSLSRHASSLIHGYRYPIIRGALVSQAGLSVSSRAEFETLVDEFDDMDGIGDVDLIDALGETMATVYGLVSETDDLLASLGYDLTTLETRDDRQFFAYYLGHLVLTDGYRAAEGHAMRRRYGIKWSYERKKMEAYDAEYAERGTAWRDLICASARESLDEFKYVLANALYWTGEVSRSDSQVTELLHQSAVEVADRIHLPEIKGRAEFEYYTAAGHRLRGRHLYAMAKARFRQARQTASRHEFLSTWKARYNEAIVHGLELTSAGNHENAVHILDEAIEDLLEYDLHSTDATRTIHHLSGQKLEIQAKQTDDTADAQELLEEAQTHFAAIGFDRSTDRIEGKIERLPEPPASDSATPDTKKDSPPVDPQPSGDTDASGESESTEVEAGVEAVDASLTTETDLQEVLIGTDPLTPPDPSAVGSADPMVGPDADEQNLPHDERDINANPDPYGY